MEIEARGVAFDAADRPADERIAYFTSLCPTSEGTIWLGFQLGPSKHSARSTIRLCRSDDGGRHWRETAARFSTVFEGTSGSLAAAELVETQPGSLALFSTWFDRSDPDRPLFDPVTEGILRSKQLRAISTDGGATWSEWEELPTAGLTGCASTGPVLKWADGTIAYPFESFKEFDDPSPARHAAWLLVSRDGGLSFEPPILVARDSHNERYYWDQRLCVADNPGEYVALFWTHDRGQKRDLRVHEKRGSIAEADSTAEPAETGIPGQIAAPLLLSDGRLLAFVVDRNRPATMSLWHSEDGGATWPPSKRLVVYEHDEKAAITQGAENVDFKQYWEDMGKWSFGHPAIRLLPDGRALLAYYAGSPDCMSIHWARVNV